MLNQKGKKTTKAIRLLTDPQPQFVSLVSHGANQTPFKVVKSDEALGDNESEVVVAGSRTTEQENSESEEIMAKAATSKKKQLVVRSDASSTASLVGLQKLTFDAAKFESVEVVRTYLDGQGYEGGDIVELEGGGYEVEAGDAENFTNIKAAKGDDGVTRHIGEAVQKDEGEDDDTGEGDDEGDDPDEGEGDNGGSPEQVTKSAVEQEQEVVTKYSSWRAEYSGATSIRGVMEDGKDGLPPAMYEIKEAMYTALRNAILAGDLDEVSTICAEFGELVVELVKLFDYATLEEDLVQKMIGSEPEQQEVATKSDSSEPAAANVDEIVELVMKQVNDKITQATQDLVTSDSLQLVSKSAKQGGEAVANLQETVAKAVEAVEQQAQTIEQQATTIGELEKTTKSQAAKIEELSSAPVFSRTLDHDSMTTQVERESQSQLSKDDTLLRNELGMS